MQTRMRIQRMNIKLKSALTTALVVFAAVAANGQAATTICKDGTTSAASGRGACSQHGGVDAKATAAAVKAAQAATRQLVVCKDGTSSPSGRGACSHHGGVAGATTNSAGDVSPRLPASVPANSPARTNSNC